MDILFRQLRTSADAPPGMGEIHIRPQAAEHRERRDIASLVLQQGLDVFPRGKGPIQRVIVGADPTLDDLLAATFTMELLAGATLPEGAKAFAHYAALAREGLKPGAIPLEASLEGIFLALRNAGGGDLTDPAVGARFATAWSRMAACLLPAIQAGVDPFTTPLFAAGSEFARERAFLTRDHEVFRQDVLGGEQWLVKIPGGPPQAMALLLRRPKSLLFKYWSRQGDEASRGQPFLLLAVLVAPGQWVFSTDPVQRLPLQPLAKALQTAESSKDAARAAKDPWFDGKPFGHTLVAAPRSGTQLSDQQVLRIVKQQVGARSIGPHNWTRRAALAVLPAAALLLAAGLAWNFWGPPTERNRGFDLDGDENSLYPSSEKSDLYLLTVGVSNYKDKYYNLGVASKDAEKLAETFATQGKPVFAKISGKILTDGEATRENIIEELSKLARLKDIVRPNDQVIVALSGHGAHFGKDDFYFLPHDFDPSKKASSAVNCDDFTRLLGNLPCRVLLILDTCHSGTVTTQLGRLGKKNQMVVIAACQSDKKAKESDQWGHGALTLALLEGLTGRLFPQAPGNPSLPKGKGADRVINLHDLNYYITNRVSTITLGRQAVVINTNGNIDLQQVPIASLGAAPARDAP